MKYMQLITARVIKRVKKSSIMHSLGISIHYRANNERPSIWHSAELITEIKCSSLMGTCPSIIHTQPLLPSHISQRIIEASNIIWKTELILCIWREINIENGVTIHVTRYRFSIHERRVDIPTLSDCKWMVAFMFLVWARIMPSSNELRLEFYAN